MKTRKIPMRMCVGCREMQEKKSLLRIVKSLERALETKIEQTVFSQLMEEIDAD